MTSVGIEYVRGGFELKIEVRGIRCSIGMIYSDFLGIYKLFECVVSYPKIIGMRESKVSLIFQSTLFHLF